MAIHVNIGEAKTRLSELIAAAIRGEEVVLDKAGVPQVRLVPIAAIAADAANRMSHQRQEALGMFREAARGFDLGLPALKGDRVDSDERFGVKIASAD